MQRHPFYADPIEHTNRYVHHNRIMGGSRHCRYRESSERAIGPTRPAVPDPLAHAFQWNSASAAALFFAVLLWDR